MDACLLSSEDETFQTPPEFLELVRKLGPIILDPCTAPNNPVGAEWFITPPADALQHDWQAMLRAWKSPDGLTFINPPYGRKLGAWASKVAQESQNGTQMVTLTPSRTDTVWWHTLAHEADAGLFWKGRITFYDSKTGEPCKTFNKKKGIWEVTPAPFPCFVGYFGKQKAAFRDVFGPYGRAL